MAAAVDSREAEAVGLLREGPRSSARTDRAPVTPRPGAGTFRRLSGGGSSRAPSPSLLSLPAGTGAAAGGGGVVGWEEGMGGGWGGGGGQRPPVTAGCREGAAPPPPPASRALDRRVVTCRPQSASLRPQ